MRMISMDQAAIIELDASRKDSEKVIEEIVRLERRIFPKHESLARSLHEELRRKNGGLLFVKVENEVLSGEGKGKREAEIIGYVMYSWVSSLCASITKLAVKDDYRRQGHGEALLKAAIERCRKRNIHRISLHVDPERTPAVCLYQKFGFEVDATIKGYYSSNRDAYRMYVDFDC